MITALKLLYDIEFMVSEKSMVPCTMHVLADSIEGAIKIYESLNRGSSKGIVSIKCKTNGVHVKMCACHCHGDGDGEEGVL